MNQRQHGSGARCVYAACERATISPPSIEALSNERTGVRKQPLKVYVRLAVQDTNLCSTSAEMRLEAGHR